MTTVSFDYIPSDNLSPSHFVEVDATDAIEQSGVRPHKALIIHYRSSTGTVGENIIKRVTKASTADGYFGIDSPAAHTAAAFLNVNERTALYVMGVDPAAGTASTGSVDFTGSTPTQSGTVNVYVGGRRYQVTVTTSSTATTLGDALVSAITADTAAPFGAANSSGDVTITANHAGPEGDDIDIRVNYLETQVTPAGVSVAVTAMSGGATSVDFTAVDGVIDQLAGTQYDTIITGITDASNIAALENELKSRWDPTIELDGHLFVGFSGSLTDFTTFTGSRNSEHSTAVSVGSSPTPPWIIAANVGGLDAARTTDDPARPRHTMWCKDVLAPEHADRWDLSDRNGALRAGGSTLKADAAGNVIIDRLVTTYQTNALGAPDTTWRSLPRKRTVSYLRWSWDTRLTVKYPDWKLADNGTNFSPGQRVVTPSGIASEALAWFQDQESNGLVENFDQFQKDLLVVRNTQDLNRIDMIMRPDVINQFVTSATKLQFRG